MVTSVGSVSLGVTLNAAGVDVQLENLARQFANASTAGQQFRATTATAVSQNFIASTQSAQSQLDALARQFSAASGGLQQLSTSIAGSVVGFQTLANVSGQVFSSIKNYAQAGLSTYTEFEKSLNAFQAFGGATTAETALLATEAKRVGLETSKTAGSAAAAAVELSKLGFSAKDTVKELGGLVALSEATGASVEVSATIVGAASNVYGRSAKDIGNITAQLANLTAADAPDFLQAISKAGAIAKANKQDLETLAAAFGLLRQSGFSAETAGTALKTSITRLAAPSAVAAKAVKELGITLRNPAGEMRNILDLIPEFRAGFAKLEATGAAGVAKKAGLVKTIFGDEAGPAFSALMETTDETIKRVSTGIRNSSGAAADTSAKLIQGLSGATEILGGTIETIQLTVGEQLAPAMTSAANSANQLLGKFLEFPAPVQQAIVVTVGLGAAFTGLVTGYTILNQLQIIQTAQTVASASVSAAKIAITTADAAVTGLLNQQLSIASVRTGLTSIATGIYAAVTGTAATATLGFAGTVAGLSLKLGLIGAAFFAVSEAVTAFTGSFGSELSGKLDEATDKITKFRAEASKAPDALKTVEAPKFDFGKTVAKNGIVEGLRGQLSEVGKSIGIGEGATSDYGAQLGGLTLNQRQAQVAMESLDKTLNATNLTWDDGSNLLKKYGLSSDINSQKVKLSTADLKKFKEEAASQTKVLDNNIDALKGVKGATESQQALINNQITLLQGQKDRIDARVKAQEKSAEADRQAAVAQGVLAPKLDDVTAALKRQKDALELKTAKEQAGIDRKQAKGDITEDQANSQKLELEKNIAKERLGVSNKAVADLKKSRAEALKSGDKETVKTLDTEIQKQEIESYKAISEVSQKQISQQKQEKEKAFKDEEESLSNSVAKTKIVESQKLTNLKQSLATGNITKEQFDGQSAQLRTQGLSSELGQEDAKIQKYRELAARGIISKEQLAKYEIATAQKVSEVTGQIADADIAKQEANKQKQIQAFEEEFKKKGQSIQSSAANQTIAAKKAQLGGASDEVTQNKTEKIQQEQTQKEIGLLEKKLAKTQQLKASGIITAKEAADREAQIQQELTQKNLSLIEQEIQAKRRAATIAIEERLSQQKLPLERQAATLGDKSQILELSSKQLTTQQGLSQALATLDQQRLGYQLQRSELLNDETGKEKLKDQIYQKQYATLLQNQAAQKATVSITRQQQQIELQRQQIIAKIAILEAEAALAKARATGASAREIAQLSQALDLRRQAATQLGKVGQAQAQINAIEDKKAAVEQRAAREQMQQAKAIEQLRAAQQKKAEAVELANKATERAIKLESIAQITAVRRAEMSGLSSVEAAKSIDQIQQQQALKEIGLLQQKLVQTKQLRASGVISAKDAAEREAQINQELAAANLSLIEKQLEAKRKAAVEAIENSLREKKSPLENRGNDLDINAQRLKSIADLANAQNSYGQTVATLEQERLQTQLKQAELSGNAATVESIKDQILKSQFAEMDRQLVSKRQMLELEIQQRNIEAERQKINGQIALLEAQAAIAKAKATGATAAEIKALQAVAGLREKQIALAAESEGRNKTVDDIRRKQLGVEEDINKEKQAQGSLDREQQKKQSAESAAKGGESGGESSGSSPSGAKTWMDGSNAIAPSNLSASVGDRNKNATPGIDSVIDPSKKAIAPEAESVKDMTVNAQNVTIKGAEGEDKTKPAEGEKPVEKPVNTAAEAQSKLDQARAALDQGIKAFNQKSSAENEASARDYAKRKGIDYNSEEGRSQAVSGAAEEAAAGGRREAALARANAEQIRADLASGKLKTTYGKMTDVPEESDGYPDLGKLQEEFKKAQSEAQALEVNTDAEKTNGKPANLAETVVKIYQLLAKQFGVTVAEDKGKSGAVTPAKPNQPNNQEQARARVAEAQAALNNYKDKWQAEADASNEKLIKDYAMRKGINTKTEEGQWKASLGAAEEAAAGGRANAALARENAAGIERDIKSGKLKGGDPNFVAQVPVNEFDRLYDNLEAAKAAIQRSNSPVSPTSQPQDAKQSLTEIGKNQLSELMAIRKLLTDSKCGNTVNLTVVSSSPSGEAAKLLTELGKGGY